MYSFEDLKETFQESIFSWDYFTDFEKVKANVKKVEKELNLLNYLIGKKNIEDELLIFFRESGLRDIFQNKHIKNLVDYCFGVEVGFDTNARKNRTGTLMENIVSNYLEEFCKKNSSYIYIEQATQKRIKEFFDYEIEIDKNRRRFDFALYNQITSRLFLIEVNYYSGGGSKLKATAGEYQYLNDFVKSQGIEFIWITDGKGWLTALNPLEETFNHNDYVVNLDMVKSGVLEEICLKIKDKCKTI